MTRKRCTNPTCYMRDTKVTTELTNCLGCDEELAVYNPLGSLFGDVDESTLSAFFGGKS